MSTPPRPLLWPSSVQVGNQALPLGQVLADMTIRHGRENVYDGPQPSTMSMTLWPVDREYSGVFAVGAGMTIRARHAATSEEHVRFAGIVSDAVLDDDALTVTGTGRLANAQRVELDITAWPPERWSDRAIRVFREAQIAARVEGDYEFDPLLYPPVNLDTGTITLETYLGSLAASVGAAIVDDPSGLVICQAIGSRLRRAAAIIELDPAIVAYTPIWRQSLEVVNLVTVQWGPDDNVQHVDARDNASVQRYGRRSHWIEQSRIVSEFWALQRTAQFLARNAYPRWIVHDLEILQPMRCAVGDRILLTGLPHTAPLPQWAPVLEGWTDRIERNEWRMTLNVSDPVLSGLALQWRDVALHAIRWAGVKPGAQWWQANSIADIRP